MNSLGKQIGSVALRYQCPLAHGGTAQPSAQSRGGQSRPRAAATRQEPQQSAENPNRRSRLEAVLLLAREPLSSRRLAQLANLSDGTEARTLLEQLGERYDARGSAIQVVQIAGGYQLMTRSAFARWLRPVAPRWQETELSGPAMETLAVVAYRQPVLRAEVEAVRGVQCGEILRQLMDRDLLRIVGRSQELGRPLLYGTTKRFLEAFGLRNLDRLPRAELLRRSEAAKGNSAEPASKE